MPKSLASCKMPEKLSTDIEWIKKGIDEIKSSISCVNEKVDDYGKEILKLQTRVGKLEEGRKVWDKVKTGLIIAIVGGLVVGCTLFLLGINP